MKSFRVNDPISCSLSVDQIKGWLRFSNRRNTEYERPVLDVHKNTKSIFSGDHRQKQPENVRLKHIYLMYYFQAFFLLLSSLRSLRLNQRRALKMHSQHFRPSKKKRRCFSSTPASFFSATYLFSLFFYEQGFSCGASEQQHKQDLRRIY